MQVKPIVGSLTILHKGQVLGLRRLSDFIKTVMKAERQCQKL